MKNEIKSSLRNATYQIREISAGRLRAHNFAFGIETLFLCVGAGLIALEIGAGPSDQADSYGLTAKGEEIAREFASAMNQRKAKANQAARNRARAMRDAGLVREGGSWS